MAPGESEVDLLKRLSNENLDRVIEKHRDIFFGMTVKNVERMKQQDRRLFVMVHFDGFNTLARAAAADTAQELQALIDSRRMTCGSIPVTEEVISEIGSESVRGKLASLTMESMFAVFEAVIDFPEGKQTLLISTSFIPFLITHQ